MLDISKLKFAIFDWDNTLVESRSSLTAAINQVLVSYNMPSWDEVKCRRDSNLSFKDNFSLIFGKKADEAYSLYRKIYLGLMPTQISVYPYVEKVLSLLVSRGVLLYIVSNKERILLEKEKKLLLPKHNFRKIVCGHEAPADKPSPQQIQFALNEDINLADITPENVWVIGDSPMDSTAALGANAQPIRIGRSIWGDEGETNSKIIYFNDFKDFFQNIGTNR